MQAKDLGTKHTCFKCGTKFYDFGKPEPVCPKCGAHQRDSPALKAPSPGERRRAPPKPVPAAVAEEPELDAELDEDAPADDDEEEAAADDDEG
jgi:predicted  nucleic acid-binding Zn-ribbon protein